DDLRDVGHAALDDGRLPACRTARDAGEATRRRVRLAMRLVVEDARLELVAAVARCDLLAQSLGDSEVRVDQSRTPPTRIWLMGSFTGVASTETPLAWKKALSFL